MILNEALKRPHTAAWCAVTLRQQWIHYLLHGSPRTVCIWDKWFNPTSPHSESLRPIVILYFHSRLGIPRGLFSYPHPNPIHMPLSHSSHMCCHNSWNGKEQCRTTSNKWNFQFFFFCFWKLIKFSFMGFKYDSSVSHMLQNTRISTVKQCTHAGCTKRLIDLHSSSFSAII
jgi:hypothetical protein